MDDSRNDLPPQVIVYHPAVMNSQLQRETVESIVSEFGPESVTSLAAVLNNEGDVNAKTIVVDTLRDMAERGTVEPLYEIWFATQDSRLTQLLAEGGWIPDFPHHLRVMRALESGDLDAILDGGREVIAPLLNSLVRSGDVLNQRALYCLRNLSNPDANDALCEAWSRTRSTVLEQLIREKGLLARKPTTVRVLTALLSNCLLEVSELGSEGIEPLLASCDDPHPLVAQRAWESLLNLVNEDAIDALVSIWAYERTARLDEIMQRSGYVARNPLTVKVLSVLKTGKFDSLEETPCDLVAPLIAAEQDDDHIISCHARTLLENILENTDAQETLCSLVIEHELPAAQEIAVRRGISPSRVDSRTLYYFLTEQWDKYEKLDFDMTMLRGAYEHGGKNLRSRIARQARRAGRLELVELVAGSRHKRRMGEMTIREWGITLGILRDRQDWEAMWRLAKTAPAVWSAQAVKMLFSASWNPQDNDNRSDFENMLSLARKCETDAPVIGVVDRPSARFKAHGRRVSTLTISSYFQSTLTTGSWDGSIRIWNMPTGEPINALQAYTHPVTCVAATPDGSLLAVGCGSHRAVLVWSMPEHKPVMRLDGHVNGVACLARSHDGRLLAAGCFDNTCRIWRLRDGSLIGVLEGHTESVRCAAFSPDNNVLATGGEDSRIRLWNVSDGRLIAILQGHRLTVRSLAFLPDGKLLASASSDNDVILWHVPDGSVFKRLIGHTNVVSALAISGDGRVLASSSWDGTVRLWTMPEGIPLGTLMEHTGPVTCLATDPESRTLVSGGHDCIVVMWNFQSGIFRRPTAREDMDKVESLVGQNHDANQRPWLDFLMAQMRLRWRFDVELFQGHPRIEAGEFDIEIEE